MLIALLVLAALLAYANGSNDNGKGVATLVGYGAATPRQALVYAAITTAVGAVVSFWFSLGLLKSFSTGLFAAGTPLTATFFIAVLVGAFAWVILATVTGLPVSTTHAIMGSLVGAALVAFGRSTIQWHALGRGFLLPLAISPFFSLLLVYAAAWPVKWAISRYGAVCVCVTETVEMTVTASESLTIKAARRVVTGNDAECSAQTGVNVLSSSKVANALHWFSGGMIGFARGWNDAPKIAALCLIAIPKHMGIAFSLVAASMAVGGCVSGRRVLETLAKKLTPLPRPESLTASLTTAGLVCFASWKGLPVSTTHVSTGAIIGAGLKNNPAGVKWNKVIEIAVSWVITLPAAGLIAAATKWVLP